VYRPTYDNFVYAHALTNTIIDICNKYPMDTIWVFGDDEFTRYRLGGKYHHRKLMQKSNK
jgi:hypothetical protein